MLNILPHDQLDVWHIKLAENTLSYERFSNLTSEEKLRAAKFRNPAHGSRWAGFRHGLKSILAKYVDVSAKEIAFSLECNKKPVLSGCNGIHFNLSHCETRGIVGISSLCSIGIDIEKRRPMKELDEIIQRFFSKQESKALADLPEPDKQKAFFRVWTRKESLIKANGLGMQMPLNDFVVPSTSQTSWFSPEFDRSCAKNGHYYLNDVMINAEFEAAVCLYSKNQEIVNKPKLTHNIYRFDEV